MVFTGFTKETFAFLLELTLNNNREWFELNKGRYREHVQSPMRALAESLVPCALSIDPGFNTRMTSVLSRIYRDTRFTADKSPYRNHAWLCFRPPNTRISDSFALWFEIHPGGFDYGIGFYSPDSRFMERYRQRLISDTQGFLALASQLEAHGYYYDAPAYKRDRFPGAPVCIKPYINVKNFSWRFESDAFSRIMRPEFIEDLKDEFLALKPIYDYVRPMLPIPFGAEV